MSSSAWPLHACRGGSLIAWLRPCHRSPARTSSTGRQALWRGPFVRLLPLVIGRQELQRPEYQFVRDLLSPEDRMSAVRRAMRAFSDRLCWVRMAIRMMARVRRWSPEPPAFAVPIGYRFTDNEACRMRPIVSRGTCPHRIATTLRDRPVPSPPRLPLTTPLSLSPHSPPRCLR